MFTTLRVCLICQRYKFKSKSQLYRVRSAVNYGVFDMSKIQIQKQITTLSLGLICILVVCLICQRYKFKSKSQPGDVQPHLSRGVFDMSKIQIQKQITTDLPLLSSYIRVCLICQRYKFKSKSQHNYEVFVLLAWSA